MQMTQLCLILCVRHERVQYYAFATVYYYANDTDVSNIMQMARMLQYYAFAHVSALIVYIGNTGMNIH